MKINAILALLAGIAFASEAPAITLITGPASISKSQSAKTQTLNCVAQNLTNKQQRVTIDIIDALGKTVRSNVFVMEPKWTSTFISNSELLPDESDHHFYCSFEVYNNKVRAYLQVEEDGVTVVSEEAHK